MNFEVVKTILAAPLPPQPPPPEEGIPLGILKGLGPLGTFEINITTAANLFGKVLSLIIGVMTIVAGIWFIFQFIIGAFGWLTAGADKTAIENAQKRILNAVIGITVVVAAIFLIDLLGRLIGLEILSPGRFIIGIWSK